MTASETHNRLAREFVMKIGGQTKTHAELMVVIESVVLASMVLSYRLYGVSKYASAEMIEEAINRAIERFTAPAAGERP